jgi:hypothetical protein
MRSLWALQSISAAAICTPPKSRFAIEQSFVESLDGRRLEGSAPRVFEQGPSSQIFLNAPLGILTTVQVGRTTP